MATGQKGSSLVLNRILLFETSFLENIYEGHRWKGLKRDYASFRFIVEELVAHSATGIAVLADWSNKELPHLPHELRRRVRLVEKHWEQWRVTESFLTPIYDEFGVEACGDGPGVFTAKRSEDYAKGFDLVDIFNLSLDLYKFILGLKHHLQIDIDLDAIHTTLEQISQIARRDESRARIAVLKGIFNCYKSYEATSLTITPAAHKRLLDVFNDLVEDIAFRDLSRQNYLLGFPTRVKRSLSKIKRTARDLVSKEPFQGMLDISSKIIATTTSVPTPDSDFAKSLFAESYLPPVISISPLIQKARRTWTKISRGDQE